MFIAHTVHTIRTNVVQSHGYIDQCGSHIEFKNKKKSTQLTENTTHTDQITFFSDDIEKVILGGQFCSYHQQRQFRQNQVHFSTF